MPTSGCQLLPGLCISVHDEQFAQQGRGVYRIQPHGERILDVLIAHFAGWDSAQPPRSQIFPGDAMVAEMAPQAIVQNLHARVLAEGMPSSARLSLLYFRIDMKVGRVSWVGCGTPTPILFRAAGESRCLNSLQPAPGLAEVPISQDCFRWRPDDALLLCMANGTAIDAHDLEQAMAQQRQLHNTPAMALHGLRAAWLDRRPHDAGVVLLLLQHHALGVELDRLELPMSLEILEPLRAFVGRHAQRAGLSEDKKAGFVLAAVEAVTNVVRHAQNLMRQAPIEILMEHLEGKLVLSIRYFGAAYHPKSVPQNHDLSTYPEGGFGQYIIEQACDQVHYGHHAGVNLVQMTVSSGA